MAGKNVADGGEGHLEGEVRLQSSFSFFQRKINRLSSPRQENSACHRTKDNLFNLSSGEGKECRIRSFICKQE
ncbi:hypothetical protein CEXT_558291 [Caerostris extrusa]|uniref:Uncharacterized protein n=1 Tax=Caerostris extrusa TaxID=172846 RepID=A0AAV4WDF8_CAEEX|nr:hypothetical protein CEXT_558291 [Caerostris extrusa]